MGAAKPNKGMVLSAAIDYISTVVSERDAAVTILRSWEAIPGSRSFRTAGRL
jgi:hypothetical protein